MNIKQGSEVVGIMSRWLNLVINLCILLMLGATTTHAADGLIISAIQPQLLADNKMQLRLEMSGSAPIPKIFHTDSPARIALDFTAVKSGLPNKQLLINEGNVSSINVIEAGERLRIIVNLTQSMPFATKIEGNSIVLTLDKPSEKLASLSAPAPVLKPLSAPLTATPVTNTPLAPSALTLKAVQVDSVAGNKLQLQLVMSGPALLPDIFRTDNPARVTLDFTGIKNGLNKKIIPVNQGAVSTITMIESADRLRVVLNLLENTAFDSKVQGNTLVLTMNNSVASPALKTAGVARPTSLPANKNYQLTSKLMPEQAISGFDFKRGDNGEGRLLVSLASPNTIVNSKEEGGKIVLSFVNTKLPVNLTKRLDFSEFATPVKYIEATSNNKESTVAITTQNKLYDYSLFQSEGLLTVEFRPLTDQEKETLDKSRVKYTGDRLSLNFQDIEIRSVIAILAEFTGQNVVAGDDVVGTITLKLDDVPWDEALDFVMMTKGLGKFETGNVTLISPLDKIKDYKKKQQETEAVVAELDPLLTEYIKINYAKAGDFRNLLRGTDVRTFGSCGSIQENNSNSSSSDTGSSVSSGSASSGMSVGSTSSASSSPSSDSDSSKTKMLNQSSLLSLRGSVVVDARTNTLIVRETAKQLEEIKKLIRRLDVPVRQVMIEARIVVASNSFAKQLGVKFGGSGSAAAGKESQFGIGDISSVPTMADYAKTPPTVTPAHMLVPTDKTTGKLKNMLVDLGTTSNPYGALGMTLVRGADYVLNLELSALQSQGLGELVSNPRVMTSDRCQAVINQGVQIPYQASSGNTGVKVSFKNALLSLGVTPQITPNGSIIMDLNISKDAVGKIYNNIPSIDTRSLTTNILVNDGETIVLGGIYEGTSNDVVDKVPFFGDLPGLGFLFTRTVKQEDKQELLIFITPKIVKDNSATEVN